MDRIGLLTIIKVFAARLREGGREGEKHVVAKVDGTITIKIIEVCTHYRMKTYYIHEI